MTKLLAILVAACSILVLASVGWNARAAAGAASGDSYIVLYKSQSVPADAAKTIQQAGGTLVYSYDQIGVAIAKSSDASFRSNLLAADKFVENTASTTRFATRLDPSDNTDAAGPPPGDLPNAAATDADSLSPLQWDMRQIHTSEA